MPPSFAPSLGAELRRAAAEAPDRTFIRMMAGQWSYGEIDRASDRVAAGLYAQGVRRGHNVSLMLPNCIEFAVLWFALAKLGAVTAPVNTAFRGKVLGDALNLVQSKLLLVHTTNYPQVAEVQATLASIKQMIVIGGEPAPGCLGYAVLQDPSLEAAPESDIGFSDLCLLLYTSGTTGRSKAAMIPHRFVLAHASQTIRGLGLTPEDVLYCPYPMFHLDAAVMTIAPALLLRGVAAIGERFSVSRYWDEMRAFKATVFDFMGATITMLWKQPPSVRDRDHVARLGWGVPLPAWAPQFEQRFGCRLVELYGLTEAGAMIFPPLGEVAPAGSCGKAFGPFELQLQDEHGVAVRDGQAGELVLRPLEPALIMDGYFAMPEETLEAFRNLWFHTGDLLRRDAEGYYYFVGRRKDMIRRRGENISAAEIEAGIERFHDVLSCAVIGVPSELTEEEVMACIVLRAHAQPDPAALIDHCMGEMAAFMVPRYIRFLGDLPRTPTDKVEKFRLVQQGITADTWDREEWNKK